MCKSNTCSAHKDKRRCQIKGFLRASILLLLSKEERYGYTLQQEIINLGLKDKVDIGSLYRNLRSLEELGYVSSTWRESSNGPEQRVYMITEKGKDRLIFFKEQLVKQKTFLNKRSY